MRTTFFISLLFVLIASACVDRLTSEIGKEMSLGISVSGFISDQPGPYEIRINSVFDIESKDSRRTPVSVRNIIISDDKGNSETLRDVDVGIYQTDPSGIRGVVGGVYKLRVELFDGRIYESTPDTILAPGSLDSVYFKFSEKYSDIGERELSLDLFFDASYDEHVNNHFLWSFRGTFESDTHPELYYQAHLNSGGCFYLDELFVPTKCNFMPPCSGYRNISYDPRNPVFVKKYDCTCCKCWYDLFNPSPILSDDYLSRGGRLTNVKAHTIPLNQWTLEHKIRLDLSQMSLTRKAFRFFKAIRNQQLAVKNLFQPVSGKIPGNFNQISGTHIVTQGIFFATAISERTQYLDRFQLPPNLVSVVSSEEPFFADDCRLLFPGSTNQKPAFWKD